MEQLYFNGKRISTGGGGTKFTIDDTLTMNEDNVLGVAIPTKGVLKEEFDRMSDEEKKGLIVVTDDDTPGGRSGEIYSTEETRIGTWIDGKALYRMVIETKTGDTINTVNRLVSWKSIGVEKLVNISGICYQSTGTMVCYPFYYGLLNDGTTVEYGVVYCQSSGYIVERHGTHTNDSQPFIIILEYTKTTD